MALKIAQILDFCGKSSGLADFENTVDRGSAVIFDADSACLYYVRILSPKRNLGWISLFSLSRYVTEFIQIISFFERSSFKLMCQTVIGTVLCYSLQAWCLLYIWAKLTVAFTCTRLLFFSDAVVVLDLNKNFVGLTDLAKKRYGSVDLHTPIQPPL